jgi:cell division protein ZipA
MNWSLILNVLLLMGVMVAIGRMLTYRSQFIDPLDDSTRQSEAKADSSDDIIAIRKIETGTSKPIISAVKPEKTNKKNLQVSSSSLLIFLSAKENRQFAGYELLQTMLAAGLRFGEGSLFHRHQNASGQGPVMCSLATATESGIFDLQNIGGFSVHGLCLFMQKSGADTIDLERFNMMLETAKQLSEGLDAHMLDDQCKLWSESSEKRYRAQLQAQPDVVVAASVAITAAN